MTTELYDSTWYDWADMKKYGPTSRHQRRLIHQLLAPLDFTSVMDTGCGVGDLLTEIKSRYPQVKELAGTEISRTAIEISRKRLPEAEFTLLDLQKAHVEKQYDLTISVDVLEHVEDDAATLSHIRAMSRRYFLAMSIQGNVMPQWEVEAVGHVRNYQYGEFQAKIQAAGFDILRVVEWGFPFYSPLYRWIQAKTAGAGTEGQYGFSRKLIAQLIYAAFWLNTSRKGDVILVLAKVR